MSSLSNAVETSIERDNSVDSIPSDQPRSVKYDEITDVDRALLIDTIREFPIIWNMEHEDNGKRLKLNEAYEQVAEAMNRTTSGEKNYPSKDSDHVKHPVFSRCT